MGRFTLACWFLLYLLVSSAVAQTFSIDRNHIIADEKVWIAEGVTIIAFVAPKDHMLPGYKPARARFSASTVTDIKAFGANVIRFQVSQPGLDPESSIFDANYVSEILSAVRVVRDQGLAVIVSMQWEPPSGLENQPNMPTDATDRAWASIIDGLKNDQGIMLQLFNEPGLPATPDNWNVWKTKMTHLVEQLRGAGANNLLLIGGLAFGRSLAGAVPITDPLNRYAYAIHPYLGKNNRTKEIWERRFGKFSRTAPVIATEWMVLGCKNGKPEKAQQLLNYLKSLQIGIVAWAYDLPGTIFARNGALTDFSPKSCKSGRGAGAGALLNKAFQPSL